jgi:hypothetical protein
MQLLRQFALLKLGNDTHFFLIVEVKPHAHLMKRALAALTKASSFIHGADGNARGGGAHMN